MSRGSNPIKVQQWRQRLERFAQSGQTVVRLANGVEIELGDDLRVVQAVVKQLLEAPSGATRAAGGPSC